MSADRTTEVLNYLSAISRDVGAFRAETASRFDRLEAEVREMRTEIADMRSDVRAITARLDRLEARILDTKADLHDLSVRVEVLENKSP